MGSPSILTTNAEGVRDFWAFYRRYTDTTIHTAATAALTIFGLLTFVDPWFAVIAIGCYVVPPVALYAFADEPPLEGEGSSRIGKSVAPPSPRERSGRDAQPTATNREAQTTAVSRDERGNPESDRMDHGVDSSDGSLDSDSNGDDGDTDFDNDDGDTDFDSDDGDTDSDSDNGDTDSDSDNGDSDSDSDS